MAQRRAWFGFSLAVSLASGAAAQGADWNSVGALVDEMRALRAANDDAGVRTVFARAAGLVPSLPDPIDDDASAACLALAREALQLGELQGGLAAGERVLAARKGKDPVRDSRLLEAYEVVGWAKEALGDPAGALDHWQRIGETFARTLAADDPALARMRLRACNSLLMLGRVQDAVRTGEGALTVLSRQLPEDDIDLNRARTTVAAFLSEAGDLARSVRLLETALEHFERTLAPEAEETERCRHILGITWARMGDNVRARSLGEAVLRTRRGRLPADHPMVLEVEQHLALVVAMEGDTRHALELGESVLAKRLASGPADHPTILDLRMNLAAMHDALGDRDGAEREVRIVVSSWEAKATPNSGSFAWALMMLADGQCERGDHAGAVATLERARELQVEDLGEENPDTLRLSQVLALARARLGDLQAAATLGQQVLDTFSSQHSDDWFGLHVVRAGLAKIRVAAGDLRAARDLQELPPRLVSLGDDHPDVIVGRGALGTTLLALGELDAARRELRAALRGRAMQIETASNVLSPVAMETMSAQLAMPVSLLLSASAGLTVRDDADDLESVVAVRGFAERRARFAAMTHAAAARNPEVERLLRTAIAARVRWRGLRTDAATPVDALRAAEDESVRADESLARSMAATNTPVPKVVRIVDLCAQLPAAAAALLTVTYARCVPGTDGAAEGAAEHVACFVVTGTGVRRFELGAATVVEKAVNTLRYHLRGQNAGPDAGPRMAAAVNAVRSLLQAALAELPAATRDLLVCPDGALAAIPWEVLPLVEGELLGDRLRVTYADNLTALDRREARPHSPSLLAVGDVDYDAAPTAAPLMDGPARGLVLRDGTESYARLSGAPAEIEHIARSFTQAFPDTSVRVLAGARASRENVAAQAPGVRYLHIVTHGEAAAARFWQSPAAAARARPTTIDRGLLARLVLAGANRQPSDAMESCMLTAAELAELDLSGCELAVLAACDTNVGERWFGEALTGLNRALQLAGVQHTITSLWKVNDDGARAFFAAFYDKLWERRGGEAASIAAALAHARAMTRSKGFGPDVWACFVHYGALTGR